MGLIRGKGYVEQQPKILPILFFCLLDAAQYANCRYIRIIAFEAISMDLSPDGDMNLKGLTKRVSQIPRGHSTHTHMGAVSPRNFKATLTY